MSELGGPHPPRAVRPGRPARPGRLVVGVVLGIVAVLVAQSVLFFALSGHPAFAASPALLYVSLLLPGVPAAGLLPSARVRRAAAGLVLGLAWGAIATAAVTAVLTAVALAVLR
ncbi:hypothetical protein [Cellulomonas aerilata]|uniref:hypothetical protein n=1 Tax=Cellulomonas aerilata TaxID=515326 RepID=UPI001649B652|nr:hypothetical protein [Cellulomonas aerilata]